MKKFLVLLLPFAASLCNAEDRPYPLLPGDAAPAITASNWVKGAATKTFEKGKVYVVDFWATWCVPCRPGFPVLSRLQKDYGDKITVIGVSVWEPDNSKVAPFVTENAEKMAYNIATDVVKPIPENTENKRLFAQQNGTTSMAWMVDSGNFGIPTIFVVDGEGKIAWIGEVEQLKETLDKVLEGSWNTSAFKETYVKEKALQKKSRPIELELNAAIAKQDWDTALLKADELIKLDKSFEGLNGFKFQTLLMSVKDKKRAYDLARWSLDNVREISAFGQMSYVIVFMAGENKAEDLDLAWDLATKANTLAEGKRSSPLATLARICWLRGDKAKAVEYQTKAVEAAPNPNAKAELQKALDDYKKG